LGFQNPDFANDIDSGKYKGVSESCGHGYCRQVIGYVFVRHSDNALPLTQRCLFFIFFEKSFF